MTFVFQACAVPLTFASVLTPFFSLTIAGVALFLASALCMTLSIRIFEFSHPLMYRPAMTKMHFSILRYNEAGILSSSLWLLFGIVLGVALVIGNSSFFVRDSFIHSIAIGFIGSAITVFAPMLLPSLLGKRAPVSGLSYGPIVLLNLGLFVRVVGDSATLDSASSSLPVWESVSGPLIVGAMIWFLIVLYNVGRNPRSRTLEPKAQAIQASGLGTNDFRDATITVMSRKTGHKTMRSTWFVEGNHEIYLIPIHGKNTKWYLNAISNPNVQLVINGRLFSGEAKNVSEKKDVEKIIHLFKVKYGERVYRNFYHDQIDRAVIVKIQ